MMSFAIRRNRTEKKRPTYLPPIKETLGVGLVDHGLFLFIRGELIRHRCSDAGAYHGGRQEKEGGKDELHA